MNSSGFSAISKIFILMAMMAAPGIASSQIRAASGFFTSSDGMYTITVEFGENTLTIVEPNKTSVFTLAGQNIYYYKNPNNGREYKIEVEDETTLAAFGSTGKTNYYFTGNAKAVNSKEQFELYQKVAEKYKLKMKEDPADAQLWSFCAAVAINRATLNAQGFKEYAKTAILSVRQIVTDQSKCPCADAIPPSLWNETK